MFKKYPSLTRDDHHKSIFWWLQQYPELKTCKYYISEKIDGVNIQLYFSPNKLYQIGKRSSFISSESSFMGVNELLATKYKTMVADIQTNVDVENITLRLYGEVFGQGIQNRCYYGDEKYLAFFDIEINGQLLAPKEFVNVAYGLKIPIAPFVAIVNTLEKALEYKHDFQSFFGPKPDGSFNITEGIVIKPYNRVYQTDQGAVFYIKRKNEKFDEKPQKSVKEPPAENIVKLREQFVDYVNKNRLLSVFSKEGEIEKPQQIGQYIKWVINDAIEDFVADTGLNINGLEQKDYKFIFNWAGSKIVQMLKEYL